MYTKDFVPKLHITIITISFYIFLRLPCNYNLLKSKEMLLNTKFFFYRIQYYQTSINIKEDEEEKRTSITYWCRFWTMDRLLIHHFSGVRAMSSLKFWIHWYVCEMRCMHLIQKWNKPNYLISLREDCKPYPHNVKLVNF